MASVVSSTGAGTPPTTGSGNPGNTPQICQPDAGDDICTACTKEACCDAVAACSQDDVCICVVLCVANGGTIEGCVGQCGVSGPLLDLGECIDGPCGPECGGNGNGS